MIFVTSLFIIHAAVASHVPSYLQLGRVKDVDKQVFVEYEQSVLSANDRIPKSNGTRVATYNIHYFETLDGRDNVDLLINDIIEMGVPSVVAVQELEKGERMERFCDEMRRLGYEYQEFCFPNNPQRLHLG